MFLTLNETTEVLTLLRRAHSHVGYPLTAANAPDLQKFTLIRERRAMLADLITKFEDLEKELR